MATRRRTTKRKTTVRRPTRRKKRTTLKLKVSPAIAREIWGVIYVAVAILTILSIKGTFGLIGDFWVNMLSPVFGWGIYIIPVMFFALATMLFFSKKVHFGPSKIFGIFLFMTAVLSIFHLSVPIESIHNYAAAGMYGGYIGFVTNFILLEVLSTGQIGAAIIFVAMFLVSLLLMFELSLKELFAFIIPEVKFELTADKKLKEKKEEKAEEVNAPEIQIHKSRIHKNIDVIYEDEDEKKEKDNIVINENRAKEVAKELSDNEKKAEEAKQEWEFPSLDLLKDGDSNVQIDDKILVDSASKIKQKLKQFGIEVAMHEVNVGPTVVQYTLKPHEGVKLSKITTLKSDIAMALAAERVRIEAPIPGKALVGIEVPNGYRATVFLREILESEEFKGAKSKLTLPLGRDVSGKPIIANLELMPHLLIAGATGSGKSVCMNTFLTSLLYQNSPQDLKMILIDPKRVELNSYNSIPHLLSPVIQDPEKAAISLRWVVAEMSRRYTELSEKRVRNIFEYNDLKDVNNLPRIVVVIDELADLMMVAGKEVEASVCRIAQLARAVGIHLIIATQRPSVDVITGLIKANIPSRIAFAVSSQIDSRTILDGMGAEDLLGRGDMLYLATGENKPRRVQGVMVTTEEIERITNRVKLTVEPDYDESITSTETAVKSLNGVPNTSIGNDEDSLYQTAFELVRETRKASASLLQRRLKVGYARAARLIDLLEENGVVGPADGAKPRKIIMD
jgi:DNA segregation ATPase FtsK/SpoIIIE, S-DNA-T family